MDFAAIRQRLAAQEGREFWRSLDELTRSEAFVEFLEHEFPRQAAGIRAAVDRRQFLKLMGASLGLGGLVACTRQPTEKIVPYVRQPERIVLGEPLYFATAMPLAGFATGLLVESHEGRPTKVEGNPEHPASLGATDAIAQASVLTLYDPDRSQVITSAGEIRTWEAFIQTVGSALAAARARGGAGLRLLTEQVSSPTLADQIASLLDAFPQARWCQYEPVGRDNVRAGARLAFGEPVETRYRVDDARVVLALDADLIGCGPGTLRYAREFARRRVVEPDQPTMNRLYVVESTPSLTGSVADHRLPLRARDVEPFARAVATELGITVRAGGDADLGSAHGFIRALARDLERHHGACLVVAGDAQPPVVHALAHAMNQRLGNVGSTVVYTAPIETRPAERTASLVDLANEMDAGAVELLLILGGNPVYTAPVDVRFAERLAKVALRVHLSAYHDETSTLCHWHVPEAHYLESWSDARAYDGTASIVQPLIAPLYEGRTAHELLGALSDQPARSSYEIVRDYWRRQRPQVDFETFWERALHDGVVAGTALPPKPVALRSDWDPGASATDSDTGLELVFRPDPYVFDGRFANNGWLQELPRPFTKLTWDNAALLAPATAERLGFANEDVVELRYRGRTVRAPVWIMPGQAPGSATVHLGWGRAQAGTVGSGRGFDAYALRTADAPYFASGLELAPTGLRSALATTQHQHGMEGRPIVRLGTLEEYRAHPDFARHQGHDPAPDETLYPPYEYRGHAWGMAIDLTRCIGCNACVVACQSENNIPVVGKDAVTYGRVMHWLRVDTYYRGDLDDPTMLHQPVPCMHCENAPCEEVCPVNATVHSSEGLNDMVYNRCVGTRYCSNNCPYKVRRFNFFLYNDWTSETLKMSRNPDVTVRSRGVMEKCTYCVQRIEYTRLQAQRQGRTIRDGEILTACQQVCPTEAIVFGDVNDPSSRVARLKAEARNYALLAELNTRPRTTYLAAVRNPNPDLPEGNT